MGIATVTASIREREEWGLVATCETTLGKKLRRERTSVEGRKAKERFQSHDSARSERSWEIEIQMRKAIERSADRGTWAEGGNTQLSPQRARQRGGERNPGFAAK